MVGHIADLRAKEVSVSADEAGTERMYGAGRAISSSAVCFGSEIDGKDGGSLVSALVQVAAL